ncbi:MAG: type II secretion system protein GspG [Pontiellaceae bacterium]|nr:type II secretion system protein GspG [Pontiellaceae bacterium]
MRRAHCAAERICSSFVQTIFSRCSYSHRAKISLTRANLSTLSTALEEYLYQTGELPSDGTNFVHTLTDQGFLRKPVKDGWKNAYVLKQTAFSLTSAGEDGKIGTFDDIVLAGGTYPTESVDGEASSAQAAQDQ